MKRVIILATETPMVLKVNFINPLGEVVVSKLFYNYINNGDGLTQAIGNWVNDGLFPSNATKGLIACLN